MAISNLLNLTHQPLNTAAADAGQARQGSRAADPLVAAGKIAASTEIAQRAESVDLENPFRLDEALARALGHALDYMNRILAPQNLSVSLAESAEIQGEPEVAVLDMNDGRVLKTYPPHEALKLYAQQRYGGVVIDGKI